MRIRGSSNTNTRLSPLEMLYGSPFLTPDLIYDTHQAVKYIINLGKVQKSVQKYGNKVLPSPKGEFQDTVSPGVWVLLKT